MNTFQGESDRILPNAGTLVPTIRVCSAHGATEDVQYREELKRPETGGDQDVEPSL
jgi:hypothetical protein